MNKILQEKGTSVKTTETLQHFRMGNLENFFFFSFFLVLLLYL